jgi:hypothetical protein
MTTPSVAGQAVPGPVPPDAVNELEAGVAQITTDEAELAAVAAAAEVPASLTTAITTATTDATAVVTDVQADEGDQ